MKILRVENTDGLGCYMWGDFDFITYHDEKNGHPSPSADSGIERRMRKNEICGFKNSNQAFNWFNKSEFIDMEKQGFQLKEIKVKKITAIGEMQVLAIR